MGAQGRRRRACAAGPALRRLWGIHLVPLTGERPSDLGATELQWAIFSPGILLIRRQSLTLVKDEAERRYRAASRVAAGG
jgi:hypothetical protein